MSVSPARLKAVAAVAEMGTFAAAARALGVSQPAVAQQVRALENAYEARLFTRERGQLTATPLARQISELSDGLDNIEVEAERLLRQQATLAGGSLRVGLGNAMPGMAVISALSQEVPSIAVKVELGSHAQIIRSVLSREMDVGVLPNVPRDRRFRRETLIEQDVVALALADHPIAVAGKTDCRTLSRYRLIFRNDGSSTQRAVDSAFRNAECEPRPALTVNTRDGVYEAVVNGLGIGFMWRFGTGRTDRVCRIPVAELDKHYPETVFALAEGLSPAVDAFFAQARGFHESADLKTCLSKAVKSER
jgi:molybdate transport repressor ModE-like protein